MHKKWRLFVAPQAAEDMDLIYDPLFKAIQKRIELLRNFPSMGRPLSGEYAGWRVTSVGLFNIYYRITKRGIEIGYVRHGKRQPPKLEQ